MVEGESWVTWAVPEILPEMYIYALKYLEIVSEHHVDERSPIKGNFIDEFITHLQSCQKGYNKIMTIAVKEHDELLELQAEKRTIEWREAYKKER